MRDFIMLQVVPKYTPHHVYTQETRGHLMQEHHRPTHLVRWRCATAAMGTQPWMEETQTGDGRELSSHRKITPIWHHMHIDMNE